MSPSSRRATTDPQKNWLDRLLSVFADVRAGEGGTALLPSGQRGAMLRAYDKATGVERGAVAMPGAQTGSPMTYMLNGKQFIVVSVSSSTMPGEIVAYAVP